MHQRERTLQPGTARAATPFAAVPGPAYQLQRNQPRLLPDPGIWTRLKVHPAGIYFSIAGFGGACVKAASELETWALSVLLAGAEAYNHW